MRTFRGIFSKVIHIGSGRVENVAKSMSSAMKKSLGAFFALFTAAMLVSACNGGNNAAAPPGTGQNCGGPPNQLEVLYPIPSSRNAPSALGNIYISTKGQLPPSNSFNFFLVQSNGNSTFTGAFAGVSASQIP